MKKGIFKNKWFWVVVGAFLLVVFIGNLFGANKDKVDTTPPAPPSQQEITPDPEKVKADIKKAVEPLVDEKYTSVPGYYCEILTMADGTGYIVDLQIPAEIEKPESTELIKTLVDGIKALNNDGIKEIRVNVLKDMKIVDDYTWPLDEK